MQNEHHAELTHPQIVVLDYGSQVTHLLAREIRKLNVYSEILEPETPLEELKKYKGIVLSGGPNSVYEEGAPQIDPAIFELGIPILGICYGHQLMMHKLGGKVEMGETREYGKAVVTVEQNAGVLSQFKPAQQTQVWMSHGDTVTELAPGFEVLAGTPDCPTAIIGDHDRNFYGLQFHPEVNHSLEGHKMLDAFLEICDCDRDWQLANYLELKTHEIQEVAGAKNVFLLISGGVDSTVAFALLAKALGSDRVHGLLVDTGFMRQGEVAAVETALKGIGVDNLTVYNASAEYFEALNEVYEPEAKRKLIGKIFLDVKDKVANQMELNDEDWLLGQGTIYPDTIESGGTKHADKIKTHHNRVDQIQQLIAEGKIIEPLADLYKDEVRAIGRLLGLPEALVERHPFPGPGLAVRTLCAQESQLPDNHAQAESEIQAFIEERGFTLEAHILPIKSVGVQGDGRTYRHPLALSHQHGATEYEVQDLLDLATELTNNFSTINRIVLTITPDKIDSVTAVTPVHLTPGRISNLQKVDAIFNELLHKYSQYNEVWQAPVVLIPIQVNEKAGESIVLRPVASTEAMTADAYPLPRTLLTSLEEAIIEQNLPVSAIFYDLTHKPPGTIEWE